MRLNHERWEEEQKAKDDGGSMKDEKKTKGEGRKKARKVKEESGEYNKRLFE